MQFSLWAGADITTSIQEKSKERVKNPPERVGWTSTSSGSLPPPPPFSPSGGSTWRATLKHFQLQLIFCHFIFCFSIQSPKREGKGGGGKLRTCNKVKTHPFCQLHAKIWPTKANWRNWDLFLLSSPLLYWAGRILRYPNVHLSLQKRLSKCWPLHNCTHTGGQTLTSPRQHLITSKIP